MMAVAIHILEQLIQDLWIGFKPQSRAYFSV